MDAAPKAVDFLVQVAGDSAKDPNTPVNDAKYVGSVASGGKLPIK